MCKLTALRALLRRTRRRVLTREAGSMITDDVSFFFPPPDGGWGWIVVLAAVILSMFINGFHSAFGVYMLSLLQTFNSSNSSIAWIGSVSYAFIMMFGPISGKLLIKYGAIKVSIIGVLIVIIGVLSSSYATDLSILFFTHGIIVGVGSSLASTPGMIMVSLYFTTRRSFATGIVMAGWAAATFVQNKLHHYLIEAFGWRVSLRIYSCILTLCIFSGCAFKPLQRHRTHPSVVDNFQSSPLKGFIIDLSLWKDRIFEVWVCSLGFAKFGFFIPFVHMIKLAGDLGISVDKASYIMVGLGVSSMFSCLMFGRLCDSERINRLYLNQASILAVGVVYFVIPFCTTFPSLVAVCSVLGFFDAGNYVLLPVLTFDLMGAEKMTIAWGFMMAVNSISCFGPPFAGWMYDLHGSYNIGFIVTGICNITAASILGCIPWLQRTSTQPGKNYLNASVCAMSNTIVSWQSPSPSFGSETSSAADLAASADEISEHSKRVSIKSILKAETTSYKSVSMSISARKKEEAVALEKPAKTEVFEPAKTEVFLVDVDSPLPEQVESTMDLKPGDELAKPEVPVPVKETEYIVPHRKEDGVAFVGIKDSDSDQTEVFESAIDLTVAEDKAKSGKAPYKRESIRSTKLTETIPHKKEDGVAFVGIEDSESDQEEVFESATDLTQAEVKVKVGKAALKRESIRFSIPHRKEDGVVFVGIDDSQSEEEERPISVTDFQPMEDLDISETPSEESELPKSVTKLGLLRSRTSTVLVDTEDDKEQIQPTEGETSKSETKLSLHRSRTSTALLDTEDEEDQIPRPEGETSKSITKLGLHRSKTSTALLDTEDDKEQIQPTEGETSKPVTKLGLHRSRTSTALLDAEDDEDQIPRPEGETSKSITKLGLHRSKTSTALLDAEDDEDQIPRPEGETSKPVTKLSLHRSRTSTALLDAEDDEDQIPRPKGETSKSITKLGLHRSKTSTALLDTDSEDDKEDDKEESAQQKKQHDRND